MSEQPRIALDVRSLALRGTHLIEASAGTGKTFTITSLFLKLIAERGLRIDQILAVTFTNAATAELRERIASRLTSALHALVTGQHLGVDPVLDYLRELPDLGLVIERLTAACREVDCAAVFTIHGFAARVLQDFPLESGARAAAELIGDQGALVLDVVTDFWISKVAHLPKDEFLAIGGEKLFDRLSSIARVAAASFDVPRVRLNAEVPSLRAALDGFADSYRSAGAQFRTHRDELRALLLGSAALNRREMNVVTVEKEFAACSAYFDAHDPSRLPPDINRLTQSKVERATKKNQITPQHFLLGVLEDFVEAANLVLQAAEGASDSLRAALCDEVQQRLTIEHHRMGSQSFDSLLSDLCLALRAPLTGSALAAHLRERLPVALIDEFQDTDPVQYEIFRSIYLSNEAMGCALYLIGDPKQSIYAFRGADVFTYLKAGAAVQGEVLTLTTSYRAGPALIAAQNTLYSRCELPFGLNEIIYDQISPAPGRDDELRLATGEAGEGLRLVYSPELKPDWLQLAANEVGSILNSQLTIEGRAVVPSDIAVLTRTNREAGEMQLRLQQLGIASIMYGDRSVFDSAEAREMRSLLVALAQPKRKDALRAALATPLLGYSLARIVELDQDLPALETWLERFLRYSDLWRTRGISRCIEFVFSELSVIKNTLVQENGERRLTNLRHLAELLHEAETTQHLGVFGLIRFLEDAIFGKGASAMGSDARQLRLESDGQAVVLTTAHKSKGLEYNIVVLPALAKPDAKKPTEAFRYHDPTLGGIQLEYRGKGSSESTLPLYETEMLQESLRLAYVALTRAKHQVVTFFCSSAEYSPLNYLLFSRLLGDGVGPSEYRTRAKELLSHDLYGCASELVDNWSKSIVVTLASSRSVSYPSNTVLAAPLHPPAAIPAILEKESTSSFSAMTRSQSLTHKSRQGRDQTDMDVTTKLLKMEVDESDRSASRVTLADFPRGARPGEALHSALELMPFQIEQEDERREIVAEQLTRYGIEKQLIPDAQRGIEEILHVEFRIQDKTRKLALYQIESRDRYSEMEFNLPVGSHRARLSVSRLAKIIKKCDFSERYFESIESLNFADFTGFFRGFIDLVYVYENKIYAIDYKSNYLGEYYSDYHPQALLTAMEEHHYLLQALLYSVALHKFGELRIVDYDFDKHFGGMQYLFLRGMNPALGDNGVFFYRPSCELVSELAQLFSVDQSIAAEESRESNVSGGQEWTMLT